MRWRMSAGAPIAGYLDRVGEFYYLGTSTNAVRFPAYARLDVRADRTFSLGRQRLTLFAEVINLLNRRNLAPGGPTISTRTGVVRNAVEKLFPILPSLGVLLEW
jgi:outer membrane receptor protein involved in Fe transport